MSNKLSFEEALAAARNYLRAEIVPLEILPDDTIERPFGWVFFYQSAAYIATGDISKAVAGNAPLIVNRFTGELIVTGTAYSIEHYICEYERSQFSL